MSAPEIQAAFQGGGANFISMLPIADAFHHCHKYKIIKIAALSGTSAGAICASLIAADCDFSQLKLYLRSSGSKHIASLVGPRAKQITELLNSSGLARWRALYNAREALKDILGDGEPVLNESAFSHFLDEILKHCSLAVNKIEELKITRGIALTLITTNLAESGGVERQTGNLKEAIRASCALPIAFRSFKILTVDHEVDGGLSDNLPVNCLKSNRRTPIFAVFPREKVNQKGISDVFSYLMSLFAATIDNNVKNSKAVVSEAFHIPADTTFSTFDFEEALKLIADDDWYNKRKSDAVAKIADFANSYGRVTHKEQFRFIDARMVDDYAQALDNIISDYAEYADHVGAQFIIRVHDKRVVESREEGNDRPADTVTKVTKLRVKSEKFRYYRSSVRMAGTTAVPSMWRAHNETKNKALPIRVLSLEKSFEKPAEDGGSNKFCLVEFLDPGTHIALGDEIHIFDTSYRKGAMIKMNARKVDSVKIANPHAYPLKVSEIVLFFPSALGGFRLEWRKEWNKGIERDCVLFRPRKEYPDDEEALGIQAFDIAPQGFLYCDVVPEAS